MPLLYLLYRCPACGHDPMEGEKDQAWCPGCGMRYARGGAGGRIQVQAPSGQIWAIRGFRLTAALEARRREERGGAEGGTVPPPTRKTQVRYRQSGQETPVQWGGELLGFAEAMGEGRRGTLQIDPGGLTLFPAAPEGESQVQQAGRGGTPAQQGHQGESRSRQGHQGRSRSRQGGQAQGDSRPHRESQDKGDFPVHWPFLDIRAVQTSSSSLQFSPRSGGLVELRFPQDSPYRWETLLREALRWAYGEAGLGRIVEFQPRVVAEGGDP